MEVQIYDAFGRPKSSQQSILGSIISEVVMGSSNTTAGDVLSLTIEGDGVTPVVFEWGATVGNSTAGSNNFMELRDAPSGGGTLYGSAYLHSAGYANLNLSNQSVIVDPWVGSKTFYLRANTTAGTLTFYGQSSGVRNFLRARRAYRHTLGTDPTRQLSYTNVGTLENGWTNYGSNWDVARYTKTAEGMVHITGLVANTSASSGYNIFTLPAELWPEKFHIFGCFNSSGGVTRVDVQSSNGAVVCHGSGANLIMSLAGINFLAAS